jgi:hypothetical protein
MIAVSERKHLSQKLSHTKQYLTRQVSGVEQAQSFRSNLRKNFPKTAAELSWAQQEDFPSRTLPRKR